MVIIELAIGKPENKEASRVLYCTPDALPKVLNTLGQEVSTDFLCYKRIAGNKRTAVALDDVEVSDSDTTHLELVAKNKLVYWVNVNTVEVIE